MRSIHLSTTRAPATWRGRLALKNETSGSRSRGRPSQTVCKTQEKMRVFLMITRALRRCLPPVSAQTFLLTSHSPKYCTTASASLSAGCCACCMFCESLGLRWRETGNTLLRSTGWWLRPVILTCYPARFIPRAH